MFICEKCNGSGAFPAKLAGGVCTTLCSLCATEWHELIRDHESFRGMNYADAIMANVVERGVLTAGAPNPTFTQAQKFHSRHSKVLFDIAIEWLGRRDNSQTIGGSENVNSRNN